MKVNLHRTLERCRSLLTHPLAAFLFSAFVLIVAWASVQTMLHWQLKETFSAEQRQNTNTAVAFKEHTLRILDTVDQAMSKVQIHFRENQIDGNYLLGIANETGMVPHILTQLSYVDAQGIFRSSNLDPDGRKSGFIDLMDRDHIRVHLKPESTPSLSTHNGLFISKPLLGKVSGTRTIQLSRSIISADGKVLGVVVASLNQSYFIDTYRGVNLGNLGEVVLAGLDGEIRAQVIGGQNIQTTLPQSKKITSATQKQFNGSLRAISSDGVERIIGFSRIGDYDLTIQTATSVQEAFKSWYDMRDTVLFLTLLLSFAVVIFGGAFILSIYSLNRKHFELQKSEAAAQRANHAKSEFLTAMSHELRTPLTSIRGFAELIEIRSKEPLIQEKSALIRKGAEHLNTLLTEILDLSKIEANAMPTHLESVNLKEIVNEVIGLYKISASSKSLKLTNSEIPKELDYIFSDKLKIKQIINNLLSNAIKFTSQGEVNLGVESINNGKSIQFSVSDTGPGIPTELHELIFEKFHQGHDRVSYQHGGTGLGLALSRSLAELLGGTLVVKSALGQGSTFTLTLPSSL